MVASIVLPFLVLLLASSSLSVNIDFTYNGFKSATNLSLGGSARTASNGVLQLTNDTHKVTGHAFFSSPIQMLLNTRSMTPTTISFSTIFVFDIITVGNLGGHGLAFAVAPTKTLRGGCCNYLGLLNSSNNGNSSNHVFAVEFDTIPKSSSFADIHESEVGVDINSVVPNVSIPTSYYANSSKMVNFKLGSGQPIQAWIDYDGVSKILNVTIAPFSVGKPSRPLISHAIDLSPVLKKYMYVGFSSSTGELSSSHYILGWSFRTNGVASSLDLSHLPLPPQPAKASSTSKFSGIKIGGVSSLATLLLVALAFSVSWHLWQKAKLAETLEDWELDYPQRFPYKDLYKATKGFKETELLGSGGFGLVYKGTLPRTGEEVAVKKISSNSRQGVREFIAEVACLGRMRHRNLVQLQGWCKRNEDLLLVYELMPNGSLDTFLFEGEKCGLLSWDQRFKILKGVALGLLYLHEEWEQVVVHRDIKSSNVLLDDDMNGRLGDFGLARLYERGKNPHTTLVVGTLGYIAPELSCTGKPMASSDVFAYGILLLEVACGRRPIKHDAPTGQLLLKDWVRECKMRGQILEAVDPKLGESYVREEVELVLKLGLVCSQSIPEVRPTMRQVIQYLNGDDSLADEVALVFLEADSLDLASPNLNLSSITMVSSNSLSGGR
ncbi:L-type lectin-domain containing receptor kinase S.4-like [Elaeis guineensis]|uniref:non-specific serine/threonine protein kinase n=1 Tax=Elaeis guineensis var. tenera TaxID=51953 RepID=A0A6I9S959_ELAGV|nr:L-type lectin-domain containing receptor kinase S.4-like [Elaeis guineensis]